MDDEQWSEPARPPGDGLLGHVRSGTENQNLPAFIVLGPGGDSSRWSSGFLPSIYQGTLVSDAESDPQKQVQYLANSRLDKSQQRRQLDLLKKMNERFLGDLEKAPELE